MRRLTFFSLAGLVLVADQLTKHWVVTTLSIYSSLRLIPNVLYFTRTTNTGAAFGVLPHATNLLSLTAIAAIIGIIVFAWRAGWPIQPAYGAGLALPLGGALGNLIDRVRLGHVIDFIEVHIGSYIWPIFNVADSAICVGVALLVLVALRTPEAAPQRQKETPTL